MHSNLASDESTHTFSRPAPSDPTISVGVATPPHFGVRSLAVKRAEETEGGR